MDDRINFAETLKANPLSIFFRPVVESDVYNIILSLNIEKALGFDEISAVSLKCCVDSITPMLCYVFNFCLFHGTWPDALKIAKITPIFKQGAQDDVGNDRPISVLPVVNKVLETIVQKELYDFLKSSHFFSSRQYGFRKGSGTHTELFELVNMLNKEIDEGKVITGLFLDLTKAFDTVVHELLLIKLEYAGVRGVVLDLFKSYFSNRKQCATANDRVSPLIDIGIGVPQGGVLSPLLFIVFINDFYDLPLHSSPFGFADDTNLFQSSVMVADNIGNLSEDFDVIVEYR